MFNSNFLIFFLTQQWNTTIQTMTYAMNTEIAKENCMSLKGIVKES